MAARRGIGAHRSTTLHPLIMDDNIGKGFGRGLSDLLGRWVGKYIDILHSIYVQIRLRSLITAKCFTFPFDTNDLSFCNIMEYTRSE